jgi:H+/gluconate symporter-like permease
VNPADPVPLLIVTFLGVALVVLLITWRRMPAFIALAAGSLFVGLAARLPLADIPRAFQSGVGDTLGFIAMVIVPPHPGPLAAIERLGADPGRTLYFNMTVPQTVATWTVLETIIAIVGLAGVLLLGLMVG